MASGNFGVQGMTTVTSKRSVAQAATEGAASDRATRVDQPLLTVIVPVYNEVQTLETILERVYDSPVNKQIIVVDDGSTDGTAELLRQLAECSPIEAHFHGTNRGKGRAIRTALEFAQGQYTIIQDGDLEYDPQDYHKLLEPLLSGEADVVYGSRYLNRRNSFSGRRTFDLGVKLLNFVVWLLYSKRISDEATCYKLFSTDVLRAMDLQCKRFEFCPEVTAKACRSGLRLHEVPIRYMHRSVTDGKKVRLSDGLEAITTLYKYRNWNCSCSVEVAFAATGIDK
jgi:glycosyltransferase involved in cell wall biosynthesis